jgi:hypothetical protein
MVQSEIADVFVGVDNVRVVSCTPAILLSNHLENQNEYK